MSEHNSEPQNLIIAIVECDILIHPLFEMADGSQAYPGLLRHFPLTYTRGKTVLVQTLAKEENDVLIGNIRMVIHIVIY